MIYFKVPIWHSPERTEKQKASVDATVQIWICPSKIQFRHVTTCLEMITILVSLENIIFPVLYLNDPGWDLWIMIYESVGMVTQKQQDVWCHLSNCFVVKLWQSNTININIYIKVNKEYKQPPIPFPISPHCRWTVVLSHLTDCQ